MTKQLVALLAAAALALPVAAQTTAPAEETPLEVQDFAVFVDPPTGFVFLKLPAGWKFVGKVEQDQMASLPSTVYTALLRGRDNGAVDVARRQPAARQPGNG